MTDRNPTARRDDATAFDRPAVVSQTVPGMLAVLLLASIGQVATYITPFTLTALMTGYSLAQRSASAAIAAEVLLLAGSMFATGKVMPKLDHRLLAVAGAAVAIAGQMLTVVGHGFASLIVARMMAGAGAGCAMAVAYGVISGSPSPARLFTIQSAFLGAMVLAVFLVLPRLQSVAGPRGQFLAIALALAIAAPLSLALRSAPIATNTPIAPPARHAALFWVLAGAVAFCGIGSNAIWLHFETLGVLRHVSFTVLVTITTLSAVLMIVAPLIALWLFRRVGGFTPFIVGCAIQGTVVAIDLLVESAVVFVACALTLNLIIVVLLVYARIFAAEIDETGSLAAGVGGGLRGGFVGPLLGGLFYVTVAANGVFAAAILAAFAVAIGFALWGASLVRARRIVPHTSLAPSIGEL